MKEAAIDFLREKRFVVGYQTPEGAGINGQFQPWSGIFAKLSNDADWNARIAKLKDELKLEDEVELP